MLMAASTIMTLPIIIVFFLAQRTFIEGVTLTGIKGKGPSGENTAHCS